jgi:DNA-binding transcriptional MocR family regulator
MPNILEARVSSGYLPLRKVLADRLAKSGCHVEANDLIVTNGCLEALSICLRAVAKPGDTIAIESPSFIGLYQVLESLGYKALEIPCHPEHGMSLEALELALERWDIKAVAIVPTFSNPLGSNMPEINRELLVELLSKRNIPLIEDDMLTELSFDGSRPKPCKAFDKKGLVLYCSSASKTIASGFRIGWIAPGAFYKEVSYLRTFSNLSVSTFAQIVIAEFIQTGRYDRHNKQMVALLAQQMRRFQQLIEKYFPAGTQLSYPGGGCILWIGLPNNISGYHFFEKAIEQGIAVIPGEISSASDKFNNCIRVNFACDPSIDLEKTIQKLAGLASSMS